MSSQTFFPTTFAPVQKKWDLSNQMEVVIDFLKQHNIDYTKGFFYNSRDQKLGTTSIEL